MPAIIIAHHHEENTSDKTIADPAPETEKIDNVPYITNRSRQRKRQENQV